MDEEPIRRARASTAGTPLAIAHPTPGLETMHGAYLRNIVALERSAEEMSSGGSDIGEEIRKLVAEDASRSRSASQSSRPEGFAAAAAGPHRIGSQRSRAPSNSYTNSVGDARWGGYSPGGFMASPPGSVHSGRSWTHSSVHRAASNSRSRLGQMGEPLHEPLQEGKPLDSPLAPSSASLYSQEHAMSRQASQSSFSYRYDNIASQIEEESHTIPPIPSTHPETIHEQQQHVEEQREQEQGQQHDGIETEPPERPRSADTFQQAEIAFKDFDGVHFSPETDEYVAVDGDGNEVQRIPARRTSSGSLLDAALLLRSSRIPPMAPGAPPPGEGMVYYPAPVPRMLNMPQRLSRMPPAAEQARRRSQVLSAMPAGSRQSAPWLANMDFEEAGTAQSPTSPQETTPPRQRASGMLNQRMSNNLQNLPPQLRASVFFDPTPVAHDVEVKSESAVATLDSILAASATAPVTAFTDHPYGGDVRQSVYAMEKPIHARKNTSTTLGYMPTAVEDKVLKKRRSSIGNFFRRNSTDVAGELKRSNSRGSALDLDESGHRLPRRQSQLSIGDQLERERALQNLEGGLVDQAVNKERTQSTYGPERATEGGIRIVSEGQQVQADFEEAEAMSDVEETEPVYAPPSTLLAELQVRKAQLKSRNRTAATAYPNGMHSTLLQLDAVEQINMKKRQKARIALAWEDPNARGQDEDSEDEDVPLGVLYPSKEAPGQRKYGDQRPIGLMERREMEDNEPLSHRMARLNPNRPLRRPPPQASQSTLHLAGQPGVDEAEGPDANETLVQRQRRLQTKDALDTAISDIAPKPGSRPVSTFSADVLSQFGGLETKDNEGEKVGGAETPVSVGADEEETLGQRRARLQRERSASGEAAETGETKAPPPLRSTNSMGNILAANPIRPRIPSKEQQAPPGTLLYNSAQNQAMQKEKLRSTNLRSAGMLNDKPIYDSAAAYPTTEPQLGGLMGEQRSRPANGAFTGGHDTSNNRRSSGGLLAAQRSRPANGQFAGGMFNPNFASGMPTSNSMFSFASPTAAAMGYAGDMGMMNPSMMGYPGGGAMPGYAQPQQSAMVNPSAYYALNGGAAPSVMNMGGAASVMGMGGAPSMMGMGMQPNPYAGMQYGAGYAPQQQMPYGMNMGELPLDPNQRAAIDRWRMGIA